MKNFDWFRIVLFILLPVLCFGGEGTLPDIASSPTLVPATSAQYNAVTNALQGHQVMRETTGAVVDNTYDIGRPSSGRPRDLHLGRNLYVAGKQIDLSSIALSSTGITSGAAKASGYPLFLQPGGAGHDYCTVSATATDMIGTIDGTAFTLETDINSDDLALAPATQNLCYVYDSLALADPAWTKTTGEFGHYIPITISGTNLWAHDGTIQTYKITNGTDTEVFIALANTVTSSYLIPLTRGIGGTDRIVYSYGDTITAVQQHFVFLDDDLLTIDTTTKYPAYSSTAPTTPATGDYWYDSDNKTWKRYSGVSWEALGRIYLGMAITDDTDCLWAEPVDFNLPWNNLISDYDFMFYTDTVYAVKNSIFKLSVAGETIETNDVYMKNLTMANIESGYSEATNTWYYLYVSKTGEFTISPIAPRKKDHRLGWYHPHEYWRCVAFFYNNSASEFGEALSNPGNGLADFNYNDIYTEKSTTGGDVQLFLNIPPIVESVCLSMFQTTSTSAGSIAIKTGPLVNMPIGVIHTNTILGTANLATNITVGQIGNCLILFEITGSYTLRFVPSHMRMDW